MTNRTAALIAATSLGLALIAGSVSAATSFSVTSGTTIDTICKGLGYTLSTPVPTPPPAPTPTPPPPAPSGNSISLSNVWITGYADGDNTPPGSPVTWLDGHEGKAGGNCTYDNPTTMAVGHVITNGVDKADFPYGTKFYVPALQCYFSAQDTCGDGSRPQDKPCHKPERGSLQLDAYVGPKGTAQCESNMTKLYSVIQNPLPGLPVKVGNICN